MLDIPLVRQIVELGSIKKFLKALGTRTEPWKLRWGSREVHEVRIGNDYPFWCITLARIKNKGGGKLSRFYLTVLREDYPRSFERAKRKRIAYAFVTLLRRDSGSRMKSARLTWTGLAWICRLTASRSRRPCHPHYRRYHPGKGCHCTGCWCNLARGSG